MPYNFETPFENFKFLSLDEEVGVKALCDLILPLPLHQYSPVPFALTDTILASGTCRTVVVEEGYIDTDYLRSYTRFYARAFPDFGKYSTRLHFFSTPVTRRDLSNLERPRFERNYLGYSVIRPLRARRVGRTVLRPTVADPEADFHLAARDFQVNLAGSRLSVHGAPFLEQDTRVSVCASACMWMTTQLAGQRWGLATASTAEITEMSLGYPLAEQALGTPGLNEEQMAEGLRKMGYNPLLVPAASRDALLELIHPYLEGGLAPILLLKFPGVDRRHAVVVVGHGYDPSMTPKQPVEVTWEGQPIRYWRSSQWIPHLIVHDDQRGLYRRLRFLSPDEAQTAPAGIDQSGCLVGIDMAYTPFADNGGWPTTTLAEVYGALVPLPPHVTALGYEAEEKSARLLRILFNLFEADPFTGLVLRTYLTTSNDFKRGLRARPGLARRVANLYRGKPLPRWLWVTEIALRPEALVDQKQDRRIRGELVLDANTSPATPDFLGLHIVGDNAIGLLALMRPGDEDASDALFGSKLIKPDQPYAALIR